MFLPSLKSFGLCHYVFFDLDYGLAVSEYFLNINYNHVGFCRASIEVSREYAKRLLSSYHMKGKPIEDIENIVIKLLSTPHMTLL